MKRVLSLAVVMLALFSALPAGATVTILYWSGTLPTGWRGGATPLGNGTETIFLGPAINSNVILASSGDFSTVLLAGGDQYTIDASVPITLGIGSLSQADSFGTRLYIQPNVTVGVPAGGGTYDIGNGSLVLRSNLTGTGPVTLLGSTGSAFIFNSVSGGNNYTGGTTVGNGTTAPTVAFWDNTPFGTGAVNFLNGASLISHNATTIANNLTFNSVGSSNPITFRNWDAKLVLSGTITLANNAIFQAQTANPARPGPDGSGVIALPGLFVRNPTVITGTIIESGGPRNVTIGNNPGIMIFMPTAGGNAYTSGTSINGTLVFGNNNGAPAIGTITIGSSGYAGLGDVSAGNFAAQFAAAKFDKNSSGAVGVDTLPGNTTVTYGNDINLSNTATTGATGFTNTSIRLGTATSAILTGTITPQGTNYQFGNGGGTLYVASNLGDTTYNGTFIRSLQLNNNSNVPLKLFLQGTNSYTGNTFASSGILVFDGANAIPTANANSLSASGSSTFVGNSYIGYTDTTGVNGGSLIGASPAAFLALFNKTTTWGTIGFDTHAGNSTANLSGPIDLTGFNDGVFLGTATSANLSGTITTSTVTNGNNAANTLRLTATNGGTLTVSSVLSGSTSLLLGSSTGNNAFSAGTIKLTGNNIYTGGTTLNGNTFGLTIFAGNSNAFGSGAITLNPGAGFMLAAIAPSVNLPNAIAFPAALPNGASLFLTGSNAFTLSGAISGDENANLNLVGPTSPTVTLSGNNGAFLGSINLNDSSRLNITSNNGAGMGTVAFPSPNATLAFSGAATAPVLYGLKGDGGHLILPTSGGGTVTVLTLDTTNGNNGHEFGGVIDGIGGSLTTDASLVVTASGGGNDFFLFGHNLYSGGTTITGSAALGLGYADSAGSGAVTINATNGGLILNTGITFTNNLVFNSGGLAGLGTFAPANISGTGQTAGKFTFGTNQLVFAGIPDASPGKLTLQGAAKFTNGGGLIELISDPTQFTTLGINNGTGLLEVQGNLDLTLLGASGFLIKLQSLDTFNGQQGFSTAIVWGQSYTIPIIQTTGGGTVLGFNAANFTFDTSQFQNGIATGSVFNVTADSTHLYLNFTAVPEPSTWALLATGAGCLGLAAWRRRRAA